MNRSCVLLAFCVFRFLVKTRAVLFFELIFLARTFQLLIVGYERRRLIRKESGRRVSGSCCFLPFTLHYLFIVSRGRAPFRGFLGCRLEVVHKSSHIQVETKETRAVFLFSPHSSGLGLNTFHLPPAPIRGKLYVPRLG